MTAHLPVRLKFRPASSHTAAPRLARTASDGARLPRKHSLRSRARPTRRWQLPDPPRGLRSSPGVPRVAGGHRPQQPGRGERPETGTPAAAAARRPAAHPTPRPQPRLLRRLGAGSPPSPKPHTRPPPPRAPRGTRLRARPRLFVRRRRRPERPRPAEPGGVGGSRPGTPAAGPAGRAASSAAEPGGGQTPSRGRGLNGGGGQVSPQTGRHAAAPCRRLATRRPAAPRLTCPRARSPEDSALPGAPGGEVSASTSLLTPTAALPPPPPSLPPVGGGGGGGPERGLTPPRGSSGPGPRSARGSGPGPEAAGTARQAARRPGWQMRPGWWRALGRAGGAHLYPPGPCQGKQRAEGPGAAAPSSSGCLSKASRVLAFVYLQTSCKLPAR